MSRGLRHLSGEVARFSAVNAVATVVAIVLFNALVHGLSGWFDGPLNQHAITAYLLANTVGMFLSYYGSRHYAFRHRQTAGPASGMPRYVAINLASFVIPVTCLWVTRHVLHWDSIYADNISGNAIGALLGAGFRFWAFRRFVFHPVHVPVLPFWETTSVEQDRPEPVLSDGAPCEDRSELDP